MAAPDHIQSIFYDLEEDIMTKTTTTSDADFPPDRPKHELRVATEHGQPATEAPAGVWPGIKSSKQFVAGFVPPDYIVDGLLQQGFLYSLTGATGAGKTCLTLRLAASFGP